MQVQGTYSSRCSYSMRQNKFLTKILDVSSVKNNNQGQDLYAQNKNQMKKEVIKFYLKIKYIVAP